MNPAVRFGLAAAAAAVIAPAGLAPVTATAAGAVTLKLTQVSPAAVTAKGRLTVSGTVGNGTGRRLKGAHVVLAVHPERLDTRDAVQAWQDGETDVADRPLDGSAKLRKLPAGHSARFSLTLPTTRLGLTDASWAFGPRGVTVQVRDAGEHVVASQRTVIVWAPAVDAEPTSLTVLSPLTAGTASAEAGAPTAATEAQLRPGGRLDRVLTATQEAKIGWAVDPAVLAAADALARGATVADPASTPTGTGTSTPAPAAGTSSPPPTAPQTPQTPATRAGRQWLARFASGIEERDVVGLPYADPDLNSVLNNNGLPLLRTADALGRRVGQRVAGQRFDSTVAWPGDGRATAAAVSPLARTGKTDVVISSSTQQVTGSRGTASGRSTLTSGGRSLDGLLYDNELSALTAAGGAGSRVLATQQLLAQLAAISLEQPDSARHVLAVTPRAWNPDPAGFTAMISALRSAPWVRLSSLKELRATAPVSGRAEPTYPAKARAAELPLGTVDRAVVLRRKVEAFAPALPDGADGADAVLDPYRARIASLLSVAWRQDRANLAAAGTEVERRTDGLTGGVRLNVGKPKWLTARASSIQLGVQNGTDHDLNLRVDVRAASGQLVVDPVTVTARANSRTNVQVPSRSVASGDVTVTAVLRNPAGGALDVPRQFVVHVRPGWEIKAVIVAGSVLSLLLVLGLLRGVRRSRDRVPPTPVPDVDDLAVQHRRAAQREQARAAATPPEAPPEAPPAVQEPAQEPSREPPTPPQKEAAR